MLRYPYGSADRPDKPERPTRIDMRDGSYEITWKSPNNGGAPILLYHLMVMDLDNGYHDNWTLVYNDTEPKWTVEGLVMGQEYVFRVAALNRVGWSEYSDNSSFTMLENISE